jgi:hypothetical protein
LQFAGRELGRARLPAVPFGVEIQAALAAGDLLRAEG